MTLLRPALSLLVFFTALTGLAYPALVTGIAQLALPHQANGSRIERDGVVVGSELLGQSFEAPGYFWGRPSATAAHPYDAAASTGSNLGPLSPALVERVEASVAHLRETGARAGDEGTPVDLVTTSGSGLDPHVSPAAALLQVDRVARARGVAPEEVRALIEQYTEERTLGVLGAPRVHVLRLNLALDERFGRLVTAAPGAP
jgi:potassium-transporting ATPase KdpC subunit